MKRVSKSTYVLFAVLFSVPVSGQSNIDSSKDTTAITHTQQPDSVAVTDTLTQKIYKSKVLKKGFYMNKDEFFNNAPSVILDFTVKDNTSTNKQRAAGIMRVKCIMQDANTAVPDKVWGFCDGKDVYVALKQFKYPTFWKLDCIGPYPYFVYPLKNASGPTEITSLILNEALPSYEIFMMDKKGRFKRVYSEDMLELFQEESDIKHSFRRALGPDIHEPNLQRTEITRKHLKLFNERLIEKE